MTRIGSLLVLLAVSYTAHGLQVTTDPLHEGLFDQSITLKCQYTTPSDGGNQYVVTWEFTGEYQGATTETILVKEGTGGETAYGQFAGRVSTSGTAADLRITRLKVEDTGSFKCSVDFYVLKDSGTVTTRLEVYRVVGNVDIVEYYTGDYVYVKHGESTTMTCKGYRGRPQARLVWLLDSKEVQGGTESYIDNKDGTYDTTSNFRYTFKREDHNKVLKCQSDQRPKIEYLTEFDHIIINTAGASTITLSITALLAGLLVHFVQKV